MANALRHMVALLVREDIAAPETSGNVEEAAASLMSQGGKTGWSYRIDTSRPIVFAAVNHPKIGMIRPRVSANVAVAESNDTHPPFKTLELSLEVTNDAGAPVQRWHVDRANEIENVYQQGPLYHLQSGGHWPDGARALEAQLEEPRWCHPPLDVILLTEVVVANFYPDKWGVLHEVESWCSLVRESQRMCLADYVQKVATLLNVGQSTALREMWAEKWGV